MDVPLHDNEQTPMAHEYVLIDVLQVDNVLHWAGPPVEVNLPTRFGDITEDLGGKEEGAGLGY